MSALASSPHVTFDHVSKKFRRIPRHDSFRDLIPALVRRAWSGMPAETSQAEFWALKDVSFVIECGSALGIMGPNGAGKSTILKLLTKLLRPTSGHCGVTGRVGALIELTAGFHPELTGRENVYFQGAVMGMKRADIARKFDEIVEFSGIPEFIDSPVKHYSSGMHARLGFAIAAYMDPEVLLIDEVLSVGDLAFQKRSMDKIEELARRGMPVIIVSHQLQRLVTLCTKAILLDRGEVIEAGSPAACVDAYVRRQAFSESDTTGCTMRLDALERIGPDVVATGAYAAVVLRGTIPDDYIPDTEEIILRVRSLESGQILFAIGKESLMPMLPARGPFAIEAELQMNVQPGLYLIESQIRRQTSTQYVGAGPQTHVRVKEGARFYGLIQMNARVTAPSEALEPAEHRRPGGRRQAALETAAQARDEGVRRHE
jgi:lipopolysaccharide transport system ATP-binding protein